MTVSFILGLEQVQNELVLMQSPGCYWVTANRQEDARLLLRQTIGMQRELTLISSAEKPDDLLTPAPQSGPDNIPLFSLPDSPQALINLTEDLSRALVNKPRLLLFYNTFNSWDKMTSGELHHWLKEMQSWLAERKSTLLIITSGPGIERLRNDLKTRYRYLEGLSHLEWHPQRWDYHIHWWSNKQGIWADRCLHFVLQQERFFLNDAAKPTSPSIPDDEHLYLAEGSVLDGDSATSANWILFDDSAQLTQRAQHASAATVIFNLSNNEQIVALVENIHRLRRSRGSALKIVVREMQTALRYSDERLLLACGVNAIVPFGTPMARFKTLLEELQGQRYNRHVPADISVLLKSAQPIQERGLLPQAHFCRAVTQMMNNAALPHNSKGLLVALRPVPELSAEQALTLCKPRRFGDLVCFAGEHLYLFLASCRCSDLNTALKYIFRLPPEEIFNQRTLWFEDADILSQLQTIADSVPMARSPAAISQKHAQQEEPAAPSLPKEADRSARPDEESPR